MVLSNRLSALHGLPAVSDKEEILGHEDGQDALRAADQNGAAASLMVRMPRGRLVVA